MPLKTWKSITAALAIAAVLAAIDLYFINVSSYIAAALAVYIISTREKPIKQQGVKILSEGRKCPYCGGKIRKVSAKKPGGVEQFKCASCHRKLEDSGRGLKQVAI